MNVLLLNILFLCFFLIKSDSNTFCGSHLIDKTKQRKLINNYLKKSEKNKEKKSKRKLSEEYIPINIIIDNKYLSYQLNTKKVSVEKYELILNALEAASSILSSLISVPKNDKKITLIKEKVIENCNLKKHYKNEYLETPLSSESILIYPRFHNFRQNGVNNILSSASFCYIDEDEGRPLAGFIYIEKNITELDMRKVNIDKYYTMIMLHELTHILVFDELLFELNEIKIDTIEILEQNRTIISSSKVLEMAQRHFGCKSLKGVELENQKYDWEKDEDKEKRNNANNNDNKDAKKISEDDGKIIDKIINSNENHFESEDEENNDEIEENNNEIEENNDENEYENEEENEEENDENIPYDKYLNHWDARIMLTDYMTSIRYDEVVISEITLALFEDSGYKVNYYTGGLFRYGKNQGCKFLDSYCINGDISPHKNEFCITEKTTMCTPGRIHRAMCGLMTYPKKLDKYYTYFTDSRKGGYLSQTDYCPVAKTNSSISKTYFYQGHCSYGEIELYPENLGYLMSNNSICLLSSLTPKGDENLKEYPSSFRALCYKVECYSNSGEKSVRIFIGDNAIMCPVSGGTQTLEGYNGYILCPDYNLICTGTEWCIDPISCVEKKSKPKSDSYEYDYQSSTSQEYKQLLNYKVPTEDKITINCKYLFVKIFYLFFVIFYL